MSQIGFKRVAETFALGSKYTDLQRELLEEELIGSVIEWRVKVYEIQRVEGGYVLTSQPYPIESSEPINLIRLVAFIQPQSEADQALLSAAVTNSELTVRGSVERIVLRSAVLASPSVVMQSQ